MILIVTDMIKWKLNRCCRLRSFVISCHKIPTIQITFVYNQCLPTQFHLTLNHLLFAHNPRKGKDLESTEWLTRSLLAIVENLSVPSGRLHQPNPVLSPNWGAALRRKQLPAKELIDQVLMIEPSQTHAWMHF